MKKSLLLSQIIAQLLFIGIGGFLGFFLKEIAYFSLILVISIFITLLIFLCFLEDRKNLSNKIIEIIDTYIRNSYLKIYNLLKK